MLDPALAGAWVGTLAWPFLRFLALLIAAPLVGARGVPMRLRVLLALIITLALAPLLPPAPVIDPLGAAGVVTAAVQIGIGLAAGFAARLAVEGLALAGQLTGLSMGLGFATLVDPNGGPGVPVLGQMYVLIGGMLLLAADGHLLLVELLATSLRTLPPGPGGLDAAGLHGLAGAAGALFGAALVLALPALMALTVAHIAVAVMARAAPALNLFAVGFPLTLGLGLVAVLLSLPALGPALADLLGDSLARLTALVLGA